jgi:hypothetical protein
LLRYLGWVLIAMMALALAAGVGLLLFGGMAERLAAPGSVRLVAFDEVVGPREEFRIRAFLEDLDYGRPVDGFWLVGRPPHGRSLPFGTNSRGVATSERLPGLPAGVYDFEAAYPDTHPRLDVQAHGTVYVLDPQTRMIWIEASAAVLAPGVPRIAGQAGFVLPEAAAVIKTVAAGRRPVYLVTAKAAEYAVFRDRLGASGLPDGPLVWVEPGAEAAGVERLKRSLPNVDGAVLCSVLLAKQAQVRGVTAVRVSAAGLKAPPADDLASWSGVAEKWPARIGPGRGTGDGN